MQHQKHQKRLDLMANFPFYQYPEIRPTQKENLEIIQKHLDSAIPGQEIILVFEDPTGAGKTGVGYTFLKTLERAGMTPLFYITPTKAAVEEVKRQHPEVKIIFGRNEYPCLYYTEEEVKADEAPCSILDCPHRVNQETGETQEKGTKPCPYYLAKYRARQGGIVVCTAAFYLLTQLFTQEWLRPAGLVIDEAHRIARIVRTTLSYEISDYHLKRAIGLLGKIDPETARILDDFLRKMMRIIRLKPALAPTLLEAHEIRELMDDIIPIHSDEVADKLREAVRARIVDPEKERETLRKLEVLIRDLRRYYHSFEYSLPTAERYPLNYTYAYYKKALEKRERIQYQLFVKSYSVASLIQQRLLSPLTLAYSATISDPVIFGWETGIRGSFYTFPSEFPVDHTRIFLPTDAPNLAVKSKSRVEPARVMRRIAKACQEFAENGSRSLVLVVSEKERQKFLGICQKLEVEAISYGNGIRAKEVIREFKKGKGQVLVGTVANYGESIDLPKQITPVIFFLRPGYPRPNDPATIFEERRHGSQRWKIWTWRVMIEALQVRGRNVRSSEDYGVTFFVSQQFGRFLYGALPEWLRDAYRGQLSFEECLREAKEIL